MTGLADDPAIDLATVALDYDAFRNLARNPHLSPNGRIGFVERQRHGYDDVIFGDILAKLPALASMRNQVVVDIGPGCAGLPHRLIALCERQGHRLILVDSPEMLALLPDIPGTTEKLAGRFPRNQAAVQRAVGDDGAAILLCYSVLQYLYVDCKLFDVIDATTRLLAPGGRALFGDIPNLSKRRRFFASAQGIAFHQGVTQSQDRPAVAFNQLAPGKIDDAVLAGLIARAQAAGCDAYLLPQGDGLPLANRRDDLLVCKP